MATDDSLSWERTRHTQMAIVRISVIVILLLVVAVLVVILGPIRNELLKRDIGTFEAQGALVKSDVESFFDQATQLAMQLPSRTRIREELVAYLQGERGRSDYVGFTKPKLLDAVDAAPEIVAVVRLSPTGEPLVAAGIPSERLPPVVTDREGPVLLAETATVQGETVIFIVAPIKAPEYGLAGYDAVAISLEGLRARMAQAAERIAAARIVVTSRGENVSIPIRAGEISVADGASIRKEKILGDGDRRAFSLNGRRYFGVHYVIEEPWHLAVVQPRADLRAPSRDAALLFGGIVLLLGVATVLISFAVLRILSRRTLAETGELTEMVESRTSQLELLLRELHHRVKNDMSLIYSMLSLHAINAEDSRVEDALKDAQGSILLMSRIYDHLYRGAGRGDVELKPFLEGLIREESAVGTSAPRQVEANIAEVTVAKGIAVPVGIIVNELLTNASKYAQPRDGYLHVTLTLAEREEGEFELVVTDNGTGFPQSVLDGKRGFGLSMVETMADQIGGRVEIRNEPHPTVRVIAAPK